MSFLIAALRVLDVVWMSGLAEVWLRNSASSGKLEFVLRLDSGITCANAKTQISKIIIISVLICAGLGGVWTKIHPYTWPSCAIGGFF